MFSCAVLSTHTVKFKTQRKKRHKGTKAAKNVQTFHAQYCKNVKNSHRSSFFIAIISDFLLPKIHLREFQSFHFGDKEDLKQIQRETPMRKFQKKPISTQQLQIDTEIRASVCYKSGYQSLYIIFLPSLVDKVTAIKIRWKPNIMAS